MVNYPINKEQFLNELLECKRPGELLSSCNLDSDFFEVFSKRILAKAIEVELFTNVEREEFKRDPILYPNLIEFKIVKSTSRYDKLVEIKKEVDYYFNLLLRRMREPFNWTSKTLMDGNSCCDSIQNILIELKDKFNPDFPTYTTFFKCFYYHSLTDFDNFYYKENHIPTILQQSEMFKGDLKEFFLEKVLEDVNRKNQKFKYAERLLNFNAIFKKIIDSQKPKKIAESVRKSEEKEGILVQDTDLSQKEIALYYYYLIESDTIPPPTPKKDGIKNFARRWKRNGESISGQTLYTAFNAMSLDSTRLKVSNLESIQKVLLRLVHSPTAKELAEKEINIIKRN